MTPREKMFQKVRAILAKTTVRGCTEAEAMTALAKAAELMTAYDISEADLTSSDKPEGITIDVDPEQSDPFLIKRFLSQGIAAFTRCESWQGGHRIYFCGFEGDAVFARWLLSTLQSYVLRELSAYKRLRKAQGLGSPRLMSASFARGCALRIKERLEELARANAVVPSSTPNALVASREDLIKAHMRAAGIKLVVNTSRYSTNPLASAAGEEAGNGARFDRPVGAAAQLRIR